MSNFKNKVNNLNENNEYVGSETVNKYSNVQLSDIFHDLNQSLTDDLRQQNVIGEFKPTLKSNDLNYLSKRRIKEIIYNKYNIFNDELANMVYSLAYKFKWTENDVYNWISNLDNVSDFIKIDNQYNNNHINRENVQKIKYIPEPCHNPQPNYIPSSNWIREELKSVLVEENYKSLQFSLQTEMLKNHIDNRILPLNNLNNIHPLHAMQYYPQLMQQHYSTYPGQQQWHKPMDYFAPNFNKKEQDEKNNQLDENKINEKINSTITSQLEQQNGEFKNMINKMQKNIDSKDDDIKYALKEILTRLNSYEDDINNLKMNSKAANYPQHDITEPPFIEKEEIVQEQVVPKKQKTKPAIENVVKIDDIDEETKKINDNKNEILEKFKKIDEMIQQSVEGLKEVEQITGDQFQISDSIKKFENI